MSRRIVIGVGIAAVVAIAAWWWIARRPGDTPTPQQARQALLDLRATSAADSPLNRVLGSLPETPTSEPADGQLSFGPCWIHHGEKIFILTVELPDVPRHQIGGRFERTPEGKWQAHVTWDSSMI